MSYPSPVKQACENARETVCRASDKAIATQRRRWPAGACTASGAGYFYIDRVDVIASGVSDRGGTQPRAGVHAPVLLFAAGIAL
jgi:hypothetical protein